MKLEKTYIAILSTHDDTTVNESLVEIFNSLSPDSWAILEHFHFIMTGGTYDRIVLGKCENITPVNDETKKLLIEKCGVTCLPGYEAGGVTILSYFITQRLCNIIWPFFTPKGFHWRRPENLAQMRLSDQWQVKRLINKRSVTTWLKTEAKSDSYRNTQKVPPVLILREGAKNGETHYKFSKNSSRGSCYEIYSKKGKKGKPEKINNLTQYVNHIKPPEKFEEMTIALIAHNEMKKNMISFAIDHEWELRKFGTILATGTTGREVAAATSQIIAKKIYRYHSGPKGGDIEIATEILFGRCHIVVFFIDPLNPHPHYDDIRTVFESCMIRENTLIITNEMHAREFMSQVVRGKKCF